MSARPLELIASFVRVEELGAAVLYLPHDHEDCVRYRDDYCTDVAGPSEPKKCTGVETKSPRNKEKRKQVVANSKDGQFRVYPLAYWAITYPVMKYGGH